MIWKLFKLHHIIPPPPPPPTPAKKKGISRALQVVWFRISKVNPFLWSFCATLYDRRFTKYRKSYSFVTMRTLLLSPSPPINKFVFRALPVVWGVYKLKPPIVNQVLRSFWGFNQLYTTGGSRDTENHAISL